MKIENFLNINEFNSFKNQNKIKLENETEINKFYNIRYNKNNPPFYHCIPLYNSAINNNQFQYIIIDFFNDKVLLTYKIIQIMKLKQIRIIDYPISLNKNKENEEIILKKIKSLNFVKVVFKDNLYNTKYINKDELYSEYNDYYYDFNKHNFNGKFRSKHGINKLLKNKDFDIQVFNNINYEIVKDLRNLWVIQMKENGSVVSNQSTKDFKKIIEYNNDNILNIILSYKKQPISIQTFIIDKKMKFADCLYINHLGRSVTDDLELNNVLKNICDIQNFIAYKELLKYDIYNLYIAGCRPTEKRLLKHKEKITDGCIKYYIDNNKGVYFGGTC